MAETVQQGSLVSNIPEETLNQLTHGAGLILSIVGAVRLLTTTGTDVYLRAGCWIYAVALVVLYATSTLSHSFDADPHRTRYRTLDQIAIFGVMAATYTPLSLFACRDGWWNVPLLLIWVMAGIGVYLKLKVTKTEMVPVWFYVTTAALPLFAGPRLMQYTGDTFFWVLAGACCYLLGVVFLVNDTRVRYFHSVWHVLVILGSICHYVVISDCAARAA
jgi:hemolysin III